MLYVEKSTNKSCARSHYSLPELFCGDLIEGDAVITGSIETVPEPGEIGTLAGVGALGTGLMLHRHRQRATTNT